MLTYKILFGSYILTKDKIFNLCVNNVLLSKVTLKLELKIQQLILLIEVMFNIFLEKKNSPHVSATSLSKLFILVLKSFHTFYIFSRILLYYCISHKHSNNLKSEIKKKKKIENIYKFFLYFPRWRE